MPQDELVIAGKDITFLVDSGATYSVLKVSEFQSPPKLSGDY